MPYKPTPFKSPPKKYQPRGLTIIYEDKDIIVVNKAHHLLTMASEREREKTAYYYLTNYVKKGAMKSRNRIFIVHRLDRDTSGVLVFAKTEKAKRYLQDEWSNFSKTYYAIVYGKIAPTEGIISSYLVENKLHRMYSTKDGTTGQFAKTGYKVLKQSSNFSLLEINLFTGRKNQIRVHFSEKGHPVVGDKMYGKADKGIKRLTLHAATLTIKHPHSKEEMSFNTEVPQYFNSFIK